MNKVKSLNRAVEIQKNQEESNKAKTLTSSQIITDVDGFVKDMMKVREDYERRTAISLRQAREGYLK